ncbi:hypothetical protein M1L60_23935 [Actinoplanes sp. TRM 88003]|uniref:Uncharacterized protein n=1 Tax=Paractinoplanes aksuensis TaxID=2939490 RepID=A0ABT1DS39_9ACTN|nr:hypothetical protein [Actinoplanes aksuensis]MCO8273650.1 hypothetical protein [Actinoplanes aksuensis]
MKLPDAGGRILRSPALAVLLVAPFFGETLSTATPPLDLILPWRLPLMVALYGCGALLCREITQRFGLGLPGLCLLGAAYAVYEEALVDRFWFDPRYWDDVGIGAYSEVWDTNLLIATHLTAFHTAVSICASVLIVERLFPASRHRPWVTRRGLIIAGCALFAALPLTYADFIRVPAAQLLAATALCALLIGCAFVRARPHHRADTETPPRTHTADRPAPHAATTDPPEWKLDAGLSEQPEPSAGRTRLRRPDRPRLLGFIAFAGTAVHFVLVYTVATTGLAWPLGTAAALAPVAVAALLIRRLATGTEGLWIVTGVLAFFLVLDIAVGLGGRYDLSLGALAVAFGLWKLHKKGLTPDRG